MKQPTRNAPTAWAAAAIIVVTLASGCSTPATREGMVPDRIETKARHPHSVSVAVSGGQATDPMWKSQISNAAFTEALIEAITTSQVFSQIIEGAGGDYLLDVVLISIQQPSFGATFTVTMETGWSLRRADSGAIVWRESVRSSHAATMGDAFAAVTRLRLATEGAAKDNIKIGLERISRLTL